ncbi:hypothetical protein [Sinorhizobium fredii]|uniref:hypothetical protein n=1 Tax=Rhizobium fredii TaxID=380 RepID=UPI0012FD682C|nr:hypothetical protein [Sinorhizobium fredii]
MTPISIHQSAAWCGHIGFAMLDQRRLDCLLDLGRACPELRQSIDVIPFIVTVSSEAI